MGSVEVQRPSCTNRLSEDSLFSDQDEGGGHLWHPQVYVLLFSRY